MKSLRIVFTGFFGAGNLGDEAILLAEVRGFSQRCAGSTFSVASFNPDRHRALGLDAFDARDSDALGKALSQADLLVVGGGGLFQDYWGWNPGDLFAPEPSNIAFYARGLLAAAAIGVPSVLFANGIGPLRDPAARRTVASLASIATGLSVRDSESADLLRAGGFGGPITVAMDPAFAIAPVTQDDPPAHPRVRIAVVPRMWTHGADPHNLLRAISAGVTRVASEYDIEVVLLRFQHPSGLITEDDGTAIKHLSESILLEPYSVRIIDPSTPEEAAGWLGSCDAVITMRLHGAILAAVAGVPSVAIGLDPKLVSNARRLGLSELVIPLQSCSPSSVESALTKALGKKELLGAALDAGVDAARKALEAAFDNALACVAKQPTAAGTRRLAVPRESNVISIALRLPDSIEQALQAVRATVTWSPSSIVATGSKRVCETLQNDQTLVGVIFLESTADSFGAFLQAVAQTMSDVSPASADVIVLDATRIDAQAATDALKSARNEYPKAAVIAAAGSRDKDAAETGAVEPNLGASWIRRDIWDEAIPHLTGLETASGCGAEVARSARRRMGLVVSASLPFAPQEDAVAIDRDLARAEGLTPSNNFYFIPRPASDHSRMITDWIAGRDVVVFPPTVGWTVSLAQRTNHMAIALAEAGHAVLYSVERAHDDEGPPREVAPGVLALSEPFSSLAFLENPIVILYSYNVECASFFRNARIVYEFIDDLSVFEGDPLLLQALHRVALEQANVVTATSAALWREVAAVRPEALYLPNAVKAADFDPDVAPEMPLPAEDAAWLEADDGPIVIYWGAVAPWFDDHLVADLAKRRPDLRFAIIGPGYERDLLALQSAAPKNLRYFGARPYGLLTTYARKASVALLPFRSGKVTRATSPLKLFEYLAATLPVVSSPLPESAAFERVLLANDVASFLDKLDQAFALRNDPSYSAWTRQAVAAHDWSARAAAIRAALGLASATSPAPLPIPADLDGDLGEKSTALSMKRSGTTTQLLQAQLMQREQTGREQFAEHQRRLQALLDHAQKDQWAISRLTEQSEQLASSVQSISNLLAIEHEKTAALEARLAEEARKNDLLQTTEHALVEKEQVLRSLSAMVCEKGESIGSLSRRVVEQNQLLRELAVEAEESRESMGRLAGQLAEKERQLAREKQQQVSLSQEKEQIVATLSAELFEREQALERTIGRLAATETRLDEISRANWPVSTESGEESMEELHDLLLATPNPTHGVAESGLGAVTLIWNSAKATDIEIRVDAPDGSLLAQGGVSGSVTTPEWVADGTIFYLQNVTGGLPLTAENTLASVTVKIERFASGSLLATPNPIPVYDGSGLAAPTLTWNATESTDVEIRVNALDGGLVFRGGPSGSIAIPKWVTDGTTFYLQNVSGGLPLTAENTLATTTVSVVNKRKKVDSLFAIPNPIRLYLGSSLGATTIVWDAIDATEVDLRLGSCDGQLLARGPACGTTTTPECFADRTLLYLQNVSDGLPLTPENTLATLTVEVAKVAVGSLLATPNPVHVKDGGHLGATTLRWKVTNSTDVEIRAGTPDGDLLVRGGARGSLTTPEPVADGTVFYLQNVSGGLPLTSANTLDTVKVLVGKQQALPSHQPRALDVICFSIIDWDFRYQRPQQIMAQFAAHGHRVFYLSTTQTLPDHSSPRVQARVIKENVWEVKLAAQRLPNVYGEVVDGDNKSTLLDSLEELRRTFKISEAVAYVMISSWTAVALEVREQFGWRVIYDCMDEWENFPGIQRPLLDGERKLVRECDLLVVTAQTLYEKWQGHNRRIVLARNAVDYEFYVANYSPNSLLTDVKYPIIGYYGAIADWFDMELMIDVARRRPAYTFVLLGGLWDADTSALAALPNVHLLGLKSYETMPQYLYHFDVCMIPFKINPITEATDPVKVYEYLSAGKPVVSVALPELSPCSEYLYIAKDRDDFVAQLDRAVMEEDDDMVDQRITFASRQTWSERYERIVGELSSATARASIVIVTYNNLELNKLCLESVLRNTHYPNYEVIVVDNDSIDGTRAYLRYMAAQHSHIQVILNQNNEGFARANNQGIARSTGDYLVLLNNDTIVPSGWLSRLLRHLENPSIGMVGPVTNFVGNEAKIAVPYQDWTEMEQFAQEHMWANDGKVAEIHMLAMFCVAFRRETYELIGPLDEQFGIGMFEDDDYSVRMKRSNLRVICAADVFVHHFGQAAFKKLIERGGYDDLFNENRRRYETKWNIQWVPHQNAPLRFEPLADSELEPAF